MLKKLLIGVMVIAAIVSPVAADETAVVEKAKVALAQELTEVVKAVKVTAEEQNLTAEQTKEAVQAAVVETTQAFVRRAKLRNERLVAAVIGGVLGAAVVGGAVYLFVVRPTKVDLESAKKTIDPKVLGGLILRTVANMEGVSGIGGVSLADFCTKLASKEVRALPEDFVGNFGDKLAEFKENDLGMLPTSL